MAPTAFTLPKKERICSRKVTDKLFHCGKYRSMVAFPLRVVYLFRDRKDLEPQTQMLVSVPKRLFKRAVKRNRVKRQVREAYRHNKHIIVDRFKETDEFDRVAYMAFIWLDDKIYTTEEVNSQVKLLMTMLSEKIKG